MNTRTLKILGAIALLVLVAGLMILAASGMTG